MIRILNDRALSNDEMLDAARRIAKEHRMGVAPLAGLYAHLFGEKEEFPPETKVAAIVRCLVDHAVARRDHSSEGEEHILEACAINML